jgi:hypothetical protein
MEKAMRKIHTALLAGAVVVGLGAIAGLAAFVPSLAGSKSATHELTLQLPGGGTETIAYAGDAAPKVTFHQAAAFWPAPFLASWTAPSFVTVDPIIAHMDRQLDMLAKMTLLMPPLTDQPLGAVALSNLPAGASYAMVSETNGDGACTRFTQITRAPSDDKPKIVSQSSGNCRAGSTPAEQSTHAVKADNPRNLSGRATTMSM